MIICKVFGKLLLTPIKNEFLCLKCYDKQTKEKAKKPVEYPRFFK